MKLNKGLLPIASLAIILAACGGTDFKKTKGGAPYKIFSDGKSQKVVEGNVVKFHITQKVKDSLLFTTYGQSPRFEQVQAVGNSYDVRSVIMDVLLNARKGDSIYVTMAMDSFIKADPTIVQKTPFKNGDQLITTIRVVEVFRTTDEARADVEKEQMQMFNTDPKIQAQKKQDDAAIQAYLTQNNIQTQKTTWGTYVQILTPGQGPKPANGQYAMLRYRGTDFSGKEFDSNTKGDKPLLPVQIGAGGLILGFEDGVKMLNKGAKAKLYIPSVIGYGEMGSPPLIQPNQNLIFEIEVVDITNTPPAPPQMPGNTQPLDTSRRQ